MNGIRASPTDPPQKNQLFRLIYQSFLLLYEYFEPILASKQHFCPIFHAL